MTSITNDRHQSCITCASFLLKPTPFFLIENLISTYQSIKILIQNHSFFHSIDARSKWARYIYLLAYVKCQRAMHDIFLLYTAYGCVMHVSYLIKSKKNKK